MASYRSRRGQSLLEVLIALALLGLLAAGSFVLLSFSFSESIIAQQRVQAENLLAQGLEAARQIRDRDYDALTAGTYGLSISGADWSLSGTSDITSSTYTRTLTITDVDEYQKDVVVTITWTPRTGRAVTLTSTTRLSGTPVVVPPSSNCYGYTITGDWTNPVSLGSGDLGPGNQGTDIVVNYPYAYLSGVASSSAKPDLFTFNVSNPSSPSLIASLDTGASGINSLSRSGNTLVAASGNDSKEFMVFDITNPTSPSLVGSADLTGTTDANTVLAINNIAVLGRKSNASTEIIFYDITTPSIPSVLASFEVGADVNDFASDEHYVYAATSSSTKDIMVFDISTPTNPTLASTYDMSGTAKNLSISFQVPDLLILGDDANQVVTVNAANPLSLTTVSSFNAGGQVKDVACVTGSLLITGTNNPNSELILLNLANLPTITQYSSLNFPQEANGVDFHNNIVYIAVRSNDALRIITSSP
jgi:prepilin-type N-terminal cleavage/methylation domain-containing protein